MSFPRTQKAPSAIVDISVTALGMSESPDIERTIHTESVASAGRRSVKYWRDTNLLLRVEIMLQLPLDPAVRIRKGNISKRASERILSDLARKS